MEVITRGDVSGVTLLWQRGPGWVLTIVCKAVFDLVPGEAVLRGNPPPPYNGDLPWDPPYARTLRAVNDLVPLKPKVDVLLTGHAHAPGGRPVRSLVTRLTMGSIDKSIEVTADRYFDRSGLLVEGAPFTRAPLVYELAAGGPGTWNPAGLALGFDGLGNLPLPNLLPGNEPPPSPDQPFVNPVGYAPIGPDWPSRVEKLGRRSLRDVPDDWHGEALPDDFPRDYFQAAPPDQQLVPPLEDLTMTLENLIPGHPALTCWLPSFFPTIICETALGTSSVTPRIDTVHIDTDYAQCTVVWRGHLPRRDPSESIRVIIALDQAARRRRAPAPPPRSSENQAVYGSRPEPPPPPPPPRAPLPSLPTAVLDTPAAKGPEIDDVDPETATELPEEADPDNAAESAPPSAIELSRDTLAPGMFNRGDLPFPIAAPRPPSNAPAAPWKDPLSNTGALPFAAAVPATPPPAPPAPPPPPAPPRTDPPIPMVMPAAPVASAPIASMPVASMPVASAPITTAPVGSVWSSGSPAAKGETIGMALTSGALALAEPRYEPGVVDEPTPVPELSKQPMQLLWFDPESVVRIRRAPVFRQILDELERQPLDRELDGSSDGTREPWELEDRRDVFELCARGHPLSARACEDAYLAAKGKGGKLIPPLVLVDGDLEIQLDELESLKATATAAAPLITLADENLRAAVEVADSFLRRPGLSAAPAVCEGLQLRIREAFAREKKALPADYLDRQAERALMTGRHYQRRDVFGGVYFRSYLRTAGEKDGLLTYLPEAVHKKVPMYRRFSARLIADVHPPQDQYETRILSLRVVVLARAT